MQSPGRIFLFISLFLVQSLYAQEQDSIDFKSLEGKNLNQALKRLGREDLKFAYDPKAAAQIEIAELPDLRSIDEFLSYVLSFSDYWYKKVQDTWLIYPKGSQIAAEMEKPTRLNFPVHGVIRDSKSGEVLPFAAVGILNNPLGTASNTDGKFTLLKVPTDTSTLIFNYLGYQVLHLKLNPSLASSSLSINLTQNSKFLPSVEIYAQTLQMIDANKRISQITLNPAQIRKLPNLGEVDLFAALRLLPGISSSEESSTGLQIRGGNSDENLVLFDGFTVYHVDHLFGVYSAFNTNAVKNVQVYKGGFDAKYGGRSSGVVSITGIDGNTTEPSGMVEMNLLSSNILFELPLVKNRASIVFAYRRAYTNVIQSPTYRKIFNNLFNASVSTPNPGEEDAFTGNSNPKFYFYDSNVKVSFKPTEKDAISLSFYKGEDNLDINFTLDDPPLLLNSFDQSQWGNTGGSIKWSRQWNNKYFSYLILGNSLYKSSLNAEETVYNEEELFYRGFFFQNSSLRDVTLRYDNIYQINEKQKLEFGLWHTDVSIAMQAEDQDFIYNDSIQEASTTALYLQNTSQLTKKLSLTYGLRATMVSNKDITYLEPRINGNYTINKQFTLKAAYGIFFQNIRRLNQQSLYLSIPETWALSNNNGIPILRSEHYIAGIAYEKNNLLINTEAYIKKETGTIDFLFPEMGYSTGDIRQYAVNGKKDIAGIEFLVQKRFRDHSAWISYTLAESFSEYPGVNQDWPFPSFNDIRHEAKAVYVYDYKRWDFSLSFIYSSGRPYTPVLGTYLLTRGDGETQQLISLGEVNSARLPAYHRADFALNYTIPIKKGVIETGFSVFNIYNNLSVKFIDYYRIPENEGDRFALGKREVYNLGFTPSLFIRLKL